ncbi:MAG: hypothetical protein AB7G88_07660 [Thermomicrobiales bacterium]
MNSVAVALAIALVLSAHGNPVQATASDFPVTPDPANCQTSAKTLDDMQAVLATPVAADATPLNRLPPGTPVRQPTATAVTAALLELFACVNAGDFLRAYALYSDDYLRQILRGSNIIALATPEPLASDEWTTILNIADIRELADGRVAATVVLDPALIPVDKIFVFVLVEQNGRWLVDDVLDELEFSLP